MNTSKCLKLLFSFLFAVLFLIGSIDAFRRGMELPVDYMLFIRAKSLEYVIGFIFLCFGILAIVGGVIVGMEPNEEEID